MAPEVLFHLVHEHANAVPAHVLALVVEIEVFVTDIGKVELIIFMCQKLPVCKQSDTYLCNITFVRFFDGLFMTLMVHKVYETLFTILSGLLIKVLFGRIKLENNGCQHRNPTSTPSRTGALNKKTGLTASCNPMMTTSGFHLNVLTSAQNTGTLPRI